MIKTAILACSTFLFISGTAMAADAIVYNEPAPVVVDTFSWTGGYIGVNAGYAGGRFKNEIEGFVPPPPGRIITPDSIRGARDITAGGFVGGIQAGYNWQLENGLVIGAEADIQGSNLKSEIKESLFDGVTYEDSRLTTKVEWFGTVRARIGYAPVERFLVYATGGLAYGKVKTSYNYDFYYPLYNASSNSNFSTSKTKAGWTVGAGAEYAITNKWTLKSEYLYTDLGKANTIATMDGNYYGDGSVSSNVKFHTVRVGLNYKF